MNILKIFGRSKSNDYLPYTNNYLPSPSYDPIISLSFTGEKTPGEISPTKDYIPDYQRLRLKSWQMFMESDIAQIVINTDINWVIGTGLNLKLEPKENVLRNLKIKIPGKEFSRDFEELFKVCKKSNNSVWSCDRNLDDNARLQRLTKIVGGDVLNIYRYSGKDRVSVQSIDGCHVMSPNSKVDIDGIKKRGNVVIHGVELDKTRKRVAYWVRLVKGTDNVKERNKDSLTIDQYYFKRIPARGEKSGRVLAKLSYGSQFRIDEVRGMPILSALLETITKIDRYKEATIGSAEERQNIPYVFQHGEKSDGENPLERNINNAIANGFPIAPEAINPSSGYNGFAVQAETAQRVATSLKKTVINLPIDATVKSIESKNELYFKEFIESNVGFLCAAVGQPPEVALMSFNSNFSASRMAGKMWEYIVSIRREQEGNDYYKPYVSLLMEVACRGELIPYSNEYLQVTKSGWIAQEAFEFCRFTGIPIPHVDPVKEVTAERLKLGKAADYLPLTSLEDSAERLNLGDYSANLEEYNRNFYQAKFILDEVAKMEAKSKQQIQATED